jgi:hypothetical protein
MTALPDIKTLNKTKELLLKNASMAVSGAYTAADDGVLNPNTVKIVPGAIIPVARNGGPQGPSLLALPRSGDFNVSQLVINDMTASIKRILLDESLPPDNMSARSATEIVERMKELAQNLGSAFGRLINETMIPLTAKILEVMDERGMIDLPLRVNGLEVKVTPVAPLAQAQAMDEINAILQYSQLMQGFGTDGAVAIKTDLVVDYIGDKLGVPATLRNNQAERAVLMEQMQQHQAIQLLRGSPIQEEHLEFVLSLEVVKHFSKISSVRALKPITSALEHGDSKYYKNHWGDLLRYETFCKLTAAASDLAPLYLP